MNKIIKMFLKTINIRFTFKLIQIFDLSRSELYFNPLIPQNQIVKPKLIVVNPDKPQSLY